MSITLKPDEPTKTQDAAKPAAEVNRGLPFMLLMALSVGLVAGVGAWGFRMLIGLFHNVLFLRQFDFNYNANVFTPTSPWGFGVILVPVVGALVVAWLVKNFAPEAKGHGVPEVMDAIHFNQGRIRPQVALIKSLASAISIGSGGSVGREGPIVQIGSAFGSTLGALFPMQARDRVALIAAGAGAGIAATFNAPLGGIVFAIELLLVSVNARNFLLVTTATVVATHLSHLLLGTYPSFYIPALELPDFHLIHARKLALFPILGILMGLVSVAFIRGLYWLEDFFEALPGNYYTRHTLGMLCVGVMLYLLARHSGHYYVEGVGYATIMEVLQGTLLSPWFLLLLMTLKLLATCLSLGSGASGGVFSPGLFIGAAGGAAFGQLGQTLFPGLELSIPTFAIAGMAATISGTTGAVLTSIIMLTEMTKDQSIVLPLVIAGSVAYAVRKGIMTDSIYTMKLRARRHSVPEGLHAAVLTSVQIQDLMTTDFAIVSLGDSGPTEAGFLIHSDGTSISMVTRKSNADAAASGIGSVGHSLRYAVVAEQATRLAAVTALCEAEAEVILVSRQSDSRRAEDIVGVITPAALARVLRTDEELS